MFWSKMPSNIFLQAPIILSQTPPKWDAWGGLNNQEAPFSARYCPTDPVSTKCASMLNSLAAPTKLVPLSERYCFTGPRTATNLLKAFMNEELLSCSTSSICTARDTRQVNKIAQRFWLLWPPLVLRKTMGQGPNVSIPTKVKGDLVPFYHMADQPFDTIQSALLASCT